MRMVIYIMEKIKRKIKNNQAKDIILDFIDKNDGIIRKKDLIEILGVNISLATIYRSINKLILKKKIIEFQLEKESFLMINNELFEIQIVCFFKCNICKKLTIIKLNNSEINNIVKQIKKGYEFVIKYAVFEFQGFCEGCLFNDSDKLKGKNMRRLLHESGSYVSRRFY